MIFFSPWPHPFAFILLSHLLPPPDLTYPLNSSCCETKSGLPSVISRFFLLLFCLFFNSTLVSGGRKNTRQRKGERQVQDTLRIFHKSSASTSKFFSLVVVTFVSLQLRLGSFLPFTFLSAAKAGSFILDHINTLRDIATVTLWPTRPLCTRPPGHFGPPVELRLHKLCI